MKRTLLLLACLLLVAGCSTDTATDQSKPTFDDADALARESVEGCTRFEVEDESDDESESKTLVCYYKEDGQKRVTDLVIYDRDKKVEEIDALIPGLTTGDAYFQNGNILVKPTGQSTPAQPVLDAKAYSEALKEKCDCGEVKTPE